jgi:hypothetical protein
LRQYCDELRAARERYSISFGCTGSSSRMFLQFREEKANRALRDENAELALEAQRTVETIESLRRQVRAAPLILVLNLNLRLVIRHRSVN